mmetsp:Transcript_8951/g.21087  ORF Transcript_8951/g.21087 Transcript_8951/m.21087 type:complete len:201 (+) Transcript_8951:1711-2313(+)
MHSSARPARSSCAPRALAAQLGALVADPHELEAGGRREEDVTEAALDTERRHVGTVHLQPRAALLCAGPRPLVLTRGRGSRGGRGGRVGRGGRGSRGGRGCGPAAGPADRRRRRRPLEITVLTRVRSRTLAVPSLRRRRSSRRGSLALRLGARLVAVGDVRALLAGRRGRPCHSRLLLQIYGGRVCGLLVCGMDGGVAVA